MKIDLKIDLQGGICLLIGTTHRGRQWLTDHTPQDTLWWHGTIVVEPRYIASIIYRAETDGLRIGMAR